MQAKFLTVIAFVTLSSGCQDAGSKLNIGANLKLAVEVTPEGDSSFTIRWNDTLGRSEGHTLLNRPYEIWCYVKDNRDTLGYYRGRSSPSDYTFFKTGDTVVDVVFAVGPNFFSDQNHQRHKEGWAMVEYDPVKLNLRQDLRKRLQIVLSKKENR